MGSFDFQHVDPGLRLLSGAACLRRLSKELDRLGCKRSVVVCGRTLSQSLLMEHVREEVGSKLVGAFSEVRAHTPAPSVEKAAALLADVDADAVIAIGGGSAVVTARAATILYCEGRPLEELATQVGVGGRMISPRLDAQKLPVFAIPTTPSTAFVKAGTAVHDPVDNRRLALFDPKTRTQTLFLHPEMSMSAPRSLAIGSALDTLSLGIEGMMSNAGDPLSDAMLSHGTFLAVTALERLAQEDSPEERMALMLSAVLCGRGSDHTGAGVATVLGHALGAAFDVDNGRIKSILLSHAIRFNELHAKKGLASLSRALSVADGQASGVISRLESLRDGLGVPSRLRDLGIPEEALLDAAERGMGDWFLGGNPRPVKGADELREILSQAW